MKRSGPRTDPCGIPCVIGIFIENEELIEIH